MTKKEIIQKFVSNYYFFTKGVNLTNPSLAEYLRGIMFNLNREEGQIKFTEDDLKYALTLKKA